MALSTVDKNTIVSNGNSKTLVQTNAIVVFKVKSMLNPITPLCNQLSIIHINEDQPLSTMMIQLNTFFIPYLKKQMHISKKFGLF